MIDLINLYAQSAQRTTAARRDDLAVIQVTGDDAPTFLHGQFVSDVRALRVGQGHLTAWCTAQGRVAYLLHLARTPRGFALIVPAIDAERMMRRLRMFVLRAKVTLELAHDWQVCGVRLTMDETNALGSAVCGRGIWHAFHADCESLCIDDNRLLLWGNASAIEALVMQREWQAVAAELWHYDEILRGYPAVSGVTADAFVPQQLNLDLLNVVSFTKGCYPGQEVIARLKYRGQVKSRLMVGTGSVPLAPGSKLYRAGVAASVGQVIRSLQANETHVALQVVVDLDCADCVIYAGDESGPSVHCALPTYAHAHLNA